MPTVRDRIAAWEKVSTDLRAACVKVAFGEDPESAVWPQSASQLAWPSVGHSEGAVPKAPSVKSRI